LGSFLKSLLGDHQGGSHACIPIFYNEMAGISICSIQQISSLSDFRPISLTSSIAKIISKLLAIRLSGQLGMLE
jgi:hypothetical protein